MTPEELALSDRVSLLCMTWQKAFKSALPKSLAERWLTTYGQTAVNSACRYVVGRKKDKREIEHPFSYIEAMLKSGERNE